MRKTCLNTGIAGALAVLGLLLSPVALQSATVIKFDTKEMSKRADKIVHGVVTKAESKAFNNNRQIYTEYTVRVSENWKGANGKTTVTFRQLGGKVGNRGYYIAGAASYKVGEEVVVFLDKPNKVNQCCFTIGLAQGKYHVEEDKNHKKVVSRKLDKLDLVDALTLAPVAAHPNKGTKYLSGLKKDVRKALGIK